MRHVVAHHAVLVVQAQQVQWGIPRSFWGGEEGEMEVGSVSG